MTVSNLCFAGQDTCAARPPLWIARWVARRGRESYGIMGTDINGHRCCKPIRVARRLRQTGRTLHHHSPRRGTELLDLTRMHLPRYAYEFAFFRSRLGFGNPAVCSPRRNPDVRRPSSMAIHRVAFIDYRAPYGACHMRPIFPLKKFEHLAYGRGGWCGEPLQREGMSLVDLE